MTAALPIGRPPGRFLSVSLALHATLFVFLSTASRFDQRTITEEKIIPVSLVPLAPEALPEAVQAPPEPAAPRPTATRAVEAPVAPTHPQPYRRAPRLDDIVVPDLINKIEPAAVPQSALKNRIPDLVKPVVIPAPTPRATPRPAAPRTSDAPRVAATPDAAKPAPVAADTSIKGVVAIGPIGDGTVVFPHAWYVAIVQNAIYQNWKIPSRLSSASPSARSAVAFRIQRNGSLSAVALKVSSGYTLLDRSAVEAVRRVTALPPLPADYKEESLDVVVYFSPQQGA